MARSATTLPVLDSGNFDSILDPEAATLAASCGDVTAFALDDGRVVVVIDPAEHPKQSEKRSQGAYLNSVPIRLSSGGRIGALATTFPVTLTVSLLGLTSDRVAEAELGKEAKRLAKLELARTEDARTAEILARLLAEREAAADVDADAPPVAMRS